MTTTNILSALPATEGNFPPCYAFSLHKCGSSLMHGMISAVVQRCAIPGLSLPDEFFKSGLLEGVWENDLSLLPVFDRRVVHFGFRKLPQLFKDSAFRLRERRFVLLVRDPRDALISQYFSFGKKSGSHVMPLQNPEAVRSFLDAQPDSEIDDYVLREMITLREKLITYRDNLNFDLGLVRRYEEVYFDKQTFLHEIFEHFGIDVPASIIAEVAQQNDIRPKVEDETRHIRKGTPGDHAQKLQPQTITQLNDTFRDVAAFYGYTL